MSKIGFLYYILLWKNLVAYPDKSENVDETLNSIPEVLPEKNFLPSSDSLKTSADIKEKDSNIQAEILLKNIGCYILVQKQLSRSAELLKRARSQPNFSLLIRRFSIDLFIICKRDMPVDKQKEALTSTDEVYLGTGVATFDEYFIDINRKDVLSPLTEEEKQEYGILTKLEEEIIHQRQAQEKEEEKKYKSPPKNSMEDDAEDDLQYRAHTEFNYFNNGWSAIIFICILGALLSFLWSKLFQKPRARSPKRKSKI